MGPKFCVGEEVATRGKHGPDFDTDRTEVINVRYFGAKEATYSFTGTDVPAGWKYQTVHTAMHKKGWWDESSLRKLPPDDRTDFEDTEFIPNKETVI